MTLLGAHSLGHVHPSTSGYGYADASANIINNAWDSTPLTFDNDYYGIMTGLVSVSTLSNILILKVVTNILMSLYSHGLISNQTDLLKMCF